MTIWHFSVKNDEGEVVLLVGDDDELVADLIVKIGNDRLGHSMFISEVELRGLAANAQFMADYLQTKKQKQSKEGTK